MKTNTDVSKALASKLSPVALAVAMTVPAISNIAVAQEADFQPMPEPPISIGEDSIPPEELAYLEIKRQAGINENNMNTNK